MKFIHIWLILCLVMCVPGSAAKDAPSDLTPSAKDAALTATLKQTYDDLKNLLEELARAAKESFDRAFS